MRCSAAAKVQPGDALVKDLIQLVAIGRQAETRPVGQIMITAAPKTLTFCESSSAGKVTDTLDAAAFCDGMRRLTGAVCVITTRDVDGLLSGLTATAVCSLSAEPPTLLCCLSRTSRTYAAILRSGVLGVNVLTDTLQPVADAFAGSGSAEQKFMAGTWTRSATGAPLLEESAASFDCRLSQSFGYGTHTVLIASVVGIATTDASPLLYRAGAYGAFRPLER